MNNVQNCYSFVKNLFRHSGYFFTALSSSPIYSNILINFGGISVRVSGLLNSLYIYVY
jgi:hypothetical protein